MKRAPLHITLLLLCHACLPGQSYSIRAYTPVDGLNQSQVSHVMQDYNGYIWVGTRNGIARFDGTSFVNFYQRDGLVDNLCQDILQRSDSTVLAVTQHGFATFTENGFEPHPLFSSDHGNRIFWGALDQKDRLWLIISDKEKNRVLYRVEDDSLINMSRIPPIPGERNRGRVWRFERDSCRFLFRDNRDTLWSYRDGTYECINTSLDFNGMAKKGMKPLHPVRHFHPPDMGLPSGTTPPQQTGRLINPVAFTLSAPDTLLLLNHRHYMQIPWKHGVVIGVYVDRDRSIWVYGEEGLFRILSTCFRNFTPGDEGLNSNIWSVVQDTNDHIWFASLNKSLQRWDGNRLVTINSHKSEFDQAFFMGSRCLSDGRIFFTHSEGVLQYRDGRFSNVPWVGAQTEKVYECPVDSTLFVGTTTDGLIIRKNGHTRIMDQFTFDRVGWVTDMAWDPAGFYWVMTSFNLARLYDDSVFIHPPGQVPLRGGYAVEVDSSGTPWFGGKKGLCMFDHKARRFREVELPGDMSTVNGLALMDEGKLLVGRMKDIVVLDTRRWKAGKKPYFRVYDVQTGFLGYEVQQDGVMRDRQGRYWISCIDRVVQFNPCNELTPHTPPLLNLQRVEVYNDSLSWHPLPGLPPYLRENPGHLTLTHRQNSIRLHFRGITSYAPGQVTYSYRLDNPGGEWSQPTHQNSLVLANLEPGNHLLEVRNANAAHAWSKPSAITLEVRPAFWQTRVFQVGSVLFFTALVVTVMLIIFRRRRQKQEKQARLQKELFDTRIREMIRQFDPHFTFNMLSSLGYFIMKGDKTTAYEHMYRFSSILRKTLSGYDKILIPLAEEISFIEEYCEMQQFILGDTFRYQLQALPPELQEIAVPRMLIHSFVENGIKHGVKPKKYGGRIFLSFERDAEQLKIRVRDEGNDRGEEVSKKTDGTSKGLALSREVFAMLEEYYGKSFSFSHTPLHENGIRYGMEVEIRLPLRL